MFAAFLNQSPLLTMVESEEKRRRELGTCYSIQIAELLSDSNSEAISIGPWLFLKAKDDPYGQT